MNLDLEDWLVLIAVIFIGFGIYLPAFFVVGYVCANYK